jgi:hypothetical protein
MKSDKQLHPPEISHMQSRTHAKEILARAGFEVCDYRFGPADLWVQAIVTAAKF